MKQEATCKFCGEPIHFDTLSDAWLHRKSNSACDFGRASTNAEPKDDER